MAAAKRATRPVASPCLRRGRDAFNRSVDAARRRTVSVVRERASCRGGPGRVTDPDHGADALRLMVEKRRSSGAALQQERAGQAASAPPGDPQASNIEDAVPGARVRQLSAERSGDTGTANSTPR